MGVRWISPFSWFDPRMPSPSIIPKHPVRIEQLGRIREDDYAWLRAKNWQEALQDPSALPAPIRAHLEAENAYTEACMAPAATLCERLFEEMKARVQDEDASPPVPDGDFTYWTRYAPGAQHPLFLRRRIAGGEEEILLDAQALSVAKPHFAIADAQHSPDHRFFAYAVDEVGSEAYEIHGKDVLSGQAWPDPPQSASGSFTFSPDGQFLFWVWRDAHNRPVRVYRRPVGAGKDGDVLIYSEADEGFFLGVGLSESRAFVLITSGNQDSSEAWFIPADNPTAAPVCFAPREAGIRYEITNWDGRWMIRTNADGAVDFKIAAAPLGQTGRGNWVDWLAHEPGRFVIELSAYQGYLVRLERVDALPRLVIRARDGAEHVLAMDEAAYDLDLVAGPPFASNIARFVYQSPTRPRIWYDYDLAAGTRTLIKAQTLPSGHDASAYETLRWSASAQDGAQIPITLLRRRDTPLDGGAPLLLYGYGAYGIAMPAGFSITRLSLVDRGWIFAIAHVRGGSERGWGWFLDGRGPKKPNSFSDFIAVAENLCAKGCARPGRIVAYGGSAGGLLVGAALNMRPDLWAGVIAAVPFVDALNTMSDASLPLTPPEWPEWGNPSQDAGAYDVIASYSPYDNIRPAAYPPVLATGGLSDPRVTYWEPAKWAAKLREYTQSDAPILLKMHMDGGHAGASGRYEALKDIAFDYAFALKAIGAAEAGGPF